MLVTNCSSPFVCQCAQPLGWPGAISYQHSGICCAVAYLELSCVLPAFLCGQTPIELNQQFHPATSTDSGHFLSGHGSSSVTPQLSSLLNTGLWSSWDWLGRAGRLLQTSHTESSASQWTQSTTFPGPRTLSLRSDPGWCRGATTQGAQPLGAKDLLFDVPQAKGSRDDSHPRSAAVASPRLGGDSLALKPQQRRVSHWGRHRAGTQEIWLQLTALPQTPAEPWRRGSWRRMSVTELYGDYDPDSYPNFTAPDFDTLTPLPFQLTPVLWASLVLYSLVFLLGVPGNAAVIWVTGFRMKRTVNTVWFLNLAVADLLCCLALPFLAVPVARGNRWELGDFACKLLPSLTILNMFASVLLLTAISLDRCALVTKPVWCQNHRTTRLAWGLSGAAWLLALLMTLPTFIFRTTHHKAFSDKVMCVMEYAPVSGYQTAVEVSIATFRFAAGFLVPFVVIATCYSLVLARVQGSCVAQCHKPTVIVLVVIVGFFACWLPCHVVGLILATHAPNTRLYKLADATQPLVVSLAYVNSCLNPIIYVGMGQGFRGLVQSLLADILQEEGADLEGEGQVQFTSTGSGQATETTV